MPLNLSNFLKTQTRSSHQTPQFKSQLKNTTKHHFFKFSRYNAFEQEFQVSNVEELFNYSSKKNFFCSVNHSSHNRYSLDLALLQVFIEKIQLKVWVVIHHEFQENPLISSLR